MYSGWKKLLKWKEKKEVGKEGAALKYFPNLQEPGLESRPENVLFYLVSLVHLNLTNAKPKISPHHKTLENNKSPSQKHSSISRRN